MYRLEYAGKELTNERFPSWNDAQRVVTKLIDQAEARAAQAQLNQTTSAIIATQRLLRKLRYGLQIVKG